MKMNISGALKISFCFTKIMINTVVILTLIISAVIPTSKARAMSENRTSSRITNNLSTNNTDFGSSTLPSSELPIETNNSDEFRPNNTESVGYFLDGPYSVSITSSSEGSGNLRYGYISIPYVYDASIRSLVFDWHGNPSGGLGSCLDIPNGCSMNPIWGGSSPFYPTYTDKMCIGSPEACNAVIGQGQWVGTGRPLSGADSHSVNTGGIGVFYNECVIKNCPNVEWDAQISNIYIIYYGTIPNNLVRRSLLSANDPKNGSGDSRECPINGCEDASATAGDPIDTRTGNFDYSLVDMSLQTIAGQLSFQRSYASLAVDTDLYPTDLGPGWTHNQDTRLIFESGAVWFKAHTLNQYKFIDNGDLTFTPFPGVLASLVYNTETSAYTLKASDQSTYTFNSTGQLETWRNEIGYGFDYSYVDNKLYRVTEPVSNRYLQFNYQNGQLTSVNDSATPARTVSFGYDSNGNLSSFTDVRGKSWTYEYDGTSHHLTTLKDPSTPAIVILSVKYDAQGRAYEQYNGESERIVKIVYNADGTSTVLDALDRENTYSFDGRSTNTGRVDSVGYAIQKTYDENFRVSQVIDQDNHALEYTWSSDGASLMHIKDAAGYETDLQYDAQNHLTQVIDPKNQVITYAYADSLLMNTTQVITDGDDITTSYTYTTSDDAPQPIGLLKTITDALNHTTSFTYDSNGQLAIITDVNNNQTHFEYDDLGRVTDITNALGRVTHYVYDPAGNVTELIQNYVPSRSVNEDNQYNLTTDYGYDDLGRLIQTIDTLGNITGYAYDNADRLKKITDADGNETTYSYNDAGQIESICDPLGQNIGYEYDTAGRLWKVKDALNRAVLIYDYYSDSTIHTETRPTAGGDFIITYENYDDLDRATRVSDNAGHWYEVNYDAYGNLLTRTDALGRVTKYDYNILGLLEAVTQNYKKTITEEDDPNATNVRTEYTYDVLGNLKTIKDANGHITVFSYDALNRLLTVTNPLGQVTEYGYEVV